MRVCGAAADWAALFSGDGAKAMNWGQEQEELEPVLVVVWLQHKRTQSMCQHTRDDAARSDGGASELRASSNAFPSA